MAYRLRVGGVECRNSNGRSLWEEYASSFRTAGLSSKIDAFDLAYESLHLYNAVDIPKTAYIEFETEEDAMVFKLKFG